jgi:iron complex outermembrane receptor protein
VFHNVYDKLRVAVPGQVTNGVVPGTFDLGLTFQNRMTGDSAGAEIAATWQLVPSWRLYGAYTYLDAHLHAGPGIAASTELTAQQSPRNQVYLQSSWNLAHRVEVDLIGRGVGELAGFDPVVPRYGSADARVAWQPTGKLTLAVVGQNLLERRHLEFGTERLLASLRVEIERSVYTTLTWRF